MNGRTVERVLFVAALLLLVLLHLDSWRPQRDVLYFGWMPEELLYRLVWMGLAWVFLLAFCRRPWAQEGEESER